jgi:hypothetical protein
MQIYALDIAKLFQPAWKSTVVVEVKHWRLTTRRQKTYAPDFALLLSE